ncbi:MAG TPA: hypothetical protein VGE09_15300 [Pseudoxanthomonas sp.]
MGGKNKKVTTGYWWEVALHDGLCLGPLDAFLEFRPGTKTAWAGRITASTTISINQPDLWGGEKDQGGVVGPLAVMFGEADQLPNAYLTGVFGNQTVAWRGIATVALEGARYGANNPWPQKRAYKVERIKQGWDAGCWYEAKAAVPIIEGGGSVPPVYSYKIGQRVVVSSPTLNDPGMCTLEMAENQGFTYTTTEEFLWFWRPHESGLTYAKTGAESDSDVVQLLLNEGLQLNETFLLKFTSGVLTMALVTDTTEPPPAPDGEAWNFQGTNPMLTTSGSLYLWTHLLLEENVGPDLPVGLYAENPAHAIVWAHTQEHCGAQPLATVNAASAQAAADWFYAQGFGICTLRYPDKESAAEFIRRIERVAGCSWTQNRADGQWYIDIANGQYTLADLPILTDDDIVSFEEVPTVLDEAVNSVSVKYFDPQRKEAITTPPLRAMGLVAEFGTIHQTYEFPELPTDALANRVAHRELLARCTPTRVFNLVTTRKTAAWRRNTYFRLQSPKRGIADMVCLLAEVNDGSLKSGAVQIKATQDIYSLPTTVYTETEQGVDTRPPSEPVPATAQLVFEAPYVDVVAALPAAEFEALAADAGFAVGVAANPGGMLDFTMRVDAGAGFANTATGDFCKTATLAADLPSQQQTAIALASASGLAGVEVGSACIVGAEWCRVDAIDTGANTIALGRGCADTVPALHLAGTQIYFYASAAAADPTEYTDGEAIDIKLLPRTGSKLLADADATTLPLTFARRLARPYPPAQLQINGVSIFEASTVDPGAGGGGGGGTGGGADPGGGAIPSTGPAVTPEGTPASTALGPNGGYADDAAYALPLPPHSPSTSLIADGDFAGADSLAPWSTASGAAPGPEWSLESDGAGGNRARYAGTGTDLYYYSQTYRMPSQPLPRYELQLSASMQAEPGMRVTVGFFTGLSTSSVKALNYEGPFDAPGALTVSKNLAGSGWFDKEVKVLPTGQHVAKYATPMVVFEKSSGLDVPSAGWFDKCYLYATKIDPAATAQTLAHLAFDTGLTGWTLQPAADAGSPTLSATAGVLAMSPTGAQRTYQNVICDDPIDLADAVGKYVGITADFWSDDPAAASGVTQNGVALGIIAKDTVAGTYAAAPILGCSYQRGDFTQREVWIRVPEITGVTWHLCASLRAATGKAAKLRAINVRVTDAVVD